MFPEALSFEEILNDATVVVDTSTLLLVGKSLLKELPPCKLVIPAIVVKELEGKRSHPTVGLFAREWLRLIEGLRVQQGVALKVGAKTVENENILLQIEPNHKNQASLPPHLQDGSNDSTILAVAYNLQTEFTTIKSDDRVVILSNDLPLRLHATLDLGLESTQFNAATVGEVKPFSGTVNVFLPQDEFARSTFNNKDNPIDFDNLVFNHMEDVHASHVLVNVFVDGDDTPIEHFVCIGGQFAKLHRKTKVGKITARTFEQDAALHYLNYSADDVPVVSLVGGAGTGKTLLSVAFGLQAVERGAYQKVMVFRSLHEMGQGQEMGFLPGDIGEKMEPWAGAIYDAIDVIAGNGNTEQDKARRDALKNMVEISPITYLRGRSLSNCYIILEEAQNFSRNEILNILSRVGTGTKIVLTADAAQVDNKFLQSGSKSDIWSIVDSLKDEEIFAHMTLTKTERSRVAAVTSRLLES